MKPLALTLDTWDFDSGEYMPLLEALKEDFFLHQFICSGYKDYCYDPQELATDCNRPYITW